MTNHLKYTLNFPKANFIANQWVENGSGKTLTIFDKYSQESIAVLPFASAEQVIQAIQAAEKGFQSYSRWSVGKRAQKLELLKDALIREKDNFAQLIVAEAGKPIDFAEMEVSRGIATLEATIRALYQFSGEIIPIDYGLGEGKTAFTKRFPVGVVVCITPFNFPLNLTLHKIAPALAVGCSFILKPPPQAPLTALFLAKLCQEAGFPDGVVNVVLADVVDAEILVKNEQVKMLSFTGSAKVGWHLKNIAGKKKVALELGGNAAVIIDETAPLQVIAPIIAKAAQLYAGQICISTQRIIVVEEVYEKILPLLVQETQKLSVGNPAERGCVVGPLIDRSNLLRITSWIDEALNKGANILTGGQILDEVHHLYAPTLLNQVSSQMRVVSEEAFAPMAVVEIASDFEEAIQKANESQYGLQAGVFTQQIERMRLAHNELEVGGVIINQVPGFRMDNMPYGGVKESGLGREGVRYTMEEMTEPRLLVY